MLALPFSLLLLAGKTVPLGTTSILLAMMPIALALISSAGTGEPAPRRTFDAALAGFAGWSSQWREGPRYRSGTPLALQPRFWR